MTLLKAKSQWIMVKSYQLHRRISSFDRRESRQWENHSSAQNSSRLGCQKGHFSRARIMLLVRLRLLNHIDHNHTLTDLLALFYWNPSELASVSHSISESQGNEVCFIFDGLDEYLQCGNCVSVVDAIVDEQFLPRACVVVTSRPITTADLKRECLITRHVEVVGFSKKDILKYIDSFPFTSGMAEKSTSARLKFYLELNHNILHMCYLPLLAAMICFIYQFNEVLPSTETKVFEEFTRLIVLRSLM